nr:fibroblast growth factor 2 [Desmodus rotundus]
MKNVRAVEMEELDGSPSPVSTKANGGRAGGPRPRFRVLYFSEVDRVSRHRNAGLQKRRAGWNPRAPRTSPPRAALRAPPSPGPPSRACVLQPQRSAPRARRGQGAVRAEGGELRVGWGCRGRRCESSDDEARRCQSGGLAACGCNWVSGSPDSGGCGDSEPQTCAPGPAGKAGPSGARLGAPGRGRAPPGGRLGGRGRGRGRASERVGGRGRGAAAPRAVPGARGPRQGPGGAMAAGSITSLPAVPDDGGSGAFPPGHFKDPKRLYCKNGGFFLRIHPDGRVDGVREKSDPHIKLQLQAEERGVVSIKGVCANRYLAMKEDGRLLASKCVTDECFFFERLESNNYNTYRSRKYSSWYVALKRTGQYKLGPKTGPGQKAILFLPMSAKS